MATARTMPTTTDEIRWIEASPRPIEKATDLGNVQVLKHSNLYLLTDQFGDIHPDGRGLGLYDGDTRRLSCAILRVSGQRPVLLQASTGSNYRGTIQLTNPRLERNLRDKVHPEESLASQKLGIARRRTLAAAGLEERLRIVNYSEARETVELELEFSNDAADIFEVRGYPRDRGTLLPVGATETRATFQYDGLDGYRTRTHVAFSERGELEAVRPDDTPNLGGAIRYRWRFPLAAGASHELTWIVWSSEGPAPADHRAEATPLVPDPPAIIEDEGTAAYHAWNRSTTAVATDNELFNLTVSRSVADLRLLVNDGPAEGQRYISAGVPWFTTLFGRDSIIAAIQTLAFRPQIAVETLDVLA